MYTFASILHWFYTFVTAKCQTLWGVVTYYCVPFSIYSCNIYLFCNLSTFSWLCLNRVARKQKHIKEKNIISWDRRIRSSREQRRARSKAMRRLVVGGWEDRGMEGSSRGMEGWRDRGSWDRGEGTWDRGDALEFACTHDICIFALFVIRLAIQSSWHATLTKHTMMQNPA